MNIILDMGTTNTRLYLIDDGENIIDSRNEKFGARNSIDLGKEKLYLLLKTSISHMLLSNDLNEKDIEFIMACGMAGSELGLRNIPHINVPIGKNELVNAIEHIELTGITKIPFLFIPGIKVSDSTGRILDVMRGEETEIIGAVSAIKKGKAVIILPGTHCKTALIDSDGRIEGFSTAMTGEMLDVIGNNSILKNSVEYSNTVINEQLVAGAEDCKKNGIMNALFHVRTNSMNDDFDCEHLFSYFLGIVLFPDVDRIAEKYSNETIYIGGRFELRTAYLTLLRHFGCTSVNELENSEFLMQKGALELGIIYNRMKQKKAIKEEIINHKIISIIRNIDRDDYIPAVEALYNGGINFAEITFDATKAKSDCETAEIIKKTSSVFKDKMYIGAGSVVTVEQVLLAAKAGAKYIISPNCDPDVIKATLENGLISIPGCFTASEAVTAKNCGADFIKVFPADSCGPGYIKALAAPLSNIDFLAVGGVNTNNAGEFLNAGVKGLGIGANLVSKKNISEYGYEWITEKAKEFVNAVNGVSTDV